MTLLNTQQQAQRGDFSSPDTDHRRPCPPCNGGPDESQAPRKPREICPGASGGQGSLHTASLSPRPWRRPEVKRLWSELCYQYKPSGHQNHHPFLFFVFPGRGDTKSPVFPAKNKKPESNHEETDNTKLREVLQNNWL